MRPRWWELAACAASPLPPETWDLHMEGEDNRGRLSTGTRARRQQAIAVCRGCPVKVQCLADALVIRSNAPHGSEGIRGGEVLDLYSRTTYVPASGECELGTQQGARRHYRRGEKPCGPCATASNLHRSNRRRAAR